MGGNIYTHRITGIGSNIYYMRESQGWVATFTPGNYRDGLQHLLQGIKGMYDNIYTRELQGLMVKFTTKESQG